MSMFAVLLQCLLFDAATTAQNPARAENAAEAVRAQYHYPRELAGFELVGDSADPNPRFGVAIQWVSPEHRDVRMDVFLYHMHKARVPVVALHEAADRYALELELSYRDTPIESGEFNSITWSPTPFDRAMEHTFFHQSQGKRVRSHTLLFYDQGHHIKIRASGPGIGASELRQLTRRLAHGFLSRFEVEQAFGRRCGPASPVYVSADDPRVGSVNAIGSEIYLPKDGDPEIAARSIETTTIESIDALSRTDCMGDGVRVQVGTRKS